MSDTQQLRSVQDGAGLPGCVMRMVAFSISGPGPWGCIGSA
jgi:hypothetical protein